MSKKGRASVAACFFFCATLNAETLATLHLVDQAQRAVQYAVVSLPADSDASSPAPAVMDQVDTQFAPHVLVVQRNTKVRFPNSDDTRHHVYSFSAAKTFELKLYRADEAPPVVFDQTGVVTLGCNIHDQMLGYIHVVDTPVFGVSDAQGRVTLPAPAGNHGETLTIWHSQLSQTIEMPLPSTSGAEAATLVLPFTLKPEDSVTEDSKLSLEERLKRFKRDAK